MTKDKGQKTDDAAEGRYKKDSRGRLVPVESIKEVDLARDELVTQIVVDAMRVSETLRGFKERTLDDIEAFCELSAEKYDAPIGGTKGNITLTSFDGRFKVLRALQEQLVFDERLQAAKALIDECLDEWTGNTRKEIKTLIRDAFQVDKEGQISTSRVLTLRRLNFDDPRWARAMEAISDSLRVAASKTYIRVYERDEKTGKYKQIGLDLSGV